METVQNLNQVTTIRTASSEVGWEEKWDHVLARLGVRRMEHRVEPGLYCIGKPMHESPVFVTANYTLSFDALRGALKGIDGYILVLDTEGINVWCAAGKGTFSTEELVRRIQATGLKDIVRHRTVILPQLGAPGVAAHTVRQHSGFKVEYGPVRAADLPAYLSTHQATPEMRRVHFPLADRLKVALVDIVPALLPMLLAAAVLYFIGGWWSAGAVIAAVLAGVLLFPALLPWLPAHDLSAKGLILGAIAALPFAWFAFSNHTGQPWVRGLWAAAILLTYTPVTALLALLFTGSTTFTSRTGVKREMAAYIPIFAWLFGSGVVLQIGSSIAKLLGVL